MDWTKTTTSPILVLMSEREPPTPAGDQPTPPSSHAGQENDPLVKAARALKETKPRFDALIVRAAPGARIASRAALRYIQEHETEIRQSAAHMARLRLRGPLRLAADLLAPNTQAKPTPAASRVCPACSTVNVAAAKFCNECGRALTD